MTPTRIHTIKKIDNYRIFQGWKPSGTVQFARVNLIYGQNGSGKSTLASLLQGCAACAADRPIERDTRYDEIVRAGLQLEVCDPFDTSTSGSSTIRLDDRSFWVRVRVFNKEFIRRNLRFEGVNGPRPEALLTIGERLADAENKLEELRPELEAKRQALSQCEQTLKPAEDAVDRKLKDTARQVVDDLRTSKIHRYRATNTYNKRQVRELLEGDPAVLEDASTELQADRERATRESMKPIYLQPRSSVLEQDGLDEACRLLAKKVVSNQLIEELVGHARRSRWVQQGLDLHEGLEECLFCGQKLTAGRINALNAHFDESVKNLQSGIDDLMKRLNDSVKVLEDYLGKLPEESDVYEDLKGDLRKACQVYGAEHEAYVEVVEMIAVALKEKKDNPFGNPALTSDLVLAAPSIAALEKVIEKHQSKMSTHDEDATKAATRVEHYHVKNAAHEYSSLKKKVEDEQAAVNELQAQIKALEKQIATLENVDVDPVPGATDLTKGLSGLLGRNELAFSVCEDGVHYAIERDGAPATHLSEGEQTAIALLYFLHSVRKDKIQGEPPIVIIDDPVSSLDRGILFGASAHIWAEFVVNAYASQVFLLTHSFDLFRQWLVQLESRQQYEDCDYRAYEMTSTAAPRGPDKFPRCPQLRRWETDKDRGRVLRSEYHFLFSRVAHAIVDRRGGESLADQMNELALMPNAARRMLEAFLSFKCPGKMSSFHVAMEEVMATDGRLDSSVRTRVERYLHTYSHFDGGDISQPLKLTEATTVLRSLFQLMHHVDPGHVSSMCKALAIDEDQLLDNPASSRGAVS